MDQVIISSIASLKIITICCAGFWWTGYKFRGICDSHTNKVKIQSTSQAVAHWAVPTSVSVALGHISADAMKATVGGYSIGS